MEWTALTLTVRTPMFLSTLPGGPAEMRVPALRGAARYWFRALAAPVFETVSGRPNLRALAEAEAEVFGAASRGKVDGPSRVVLQLRRAPSATVQQAPPWLGNVPTGERPDHGIGYLLGQAFYLPPSQTQGRPQPALRRPSHFAPSRTGTTAEFRLRVVPGDGLDAAYLRETVAISLWAAATFGGLGARTHRGWGGFTLDGLDALTADPTLLGGGAGVLPTRDHPAIRRLQQIVAAHHPGARVPADDAAPAALGKGQPPWPEAPTWSRWHVHGSRQVDTWPNLLTAAGRALRAFRADVDRTQPPHSMQNLPAHRRWATREYVNAVVPAKRGDPLVDPTTRIGSFGLPIVFGTDAVVNLTQGGQTLRRASPLSIRLVPVGGDRFRLLYHVFEARIGPPKSTVDLTVGRESHPLHLCEPQAYSTIAEFLAIAP